MPTGLQITFWMIQAFNLVFTPHIDVALIPYLLSTFLCLQVGSFGCLFAVARHAVGFLKRCRFDIFNVQFLQ
jgi:hypothetical protein